ncbi:carbohydrate ABC transporter permease [Paenibacillaceae bacterium WGS1546]|uniref:carbohydrate ABC transporter permease n=1 Tax=Cohnella sp. WGS1546 TaxID=3366810 RepID=UPI00372D2ECF
MRKFKPRYTLRLHENLVAYLFLLPSLLGFALIIAFPIVASALLSMTEWNFLSGFEGIRFVGFDNFWRLLSNQDEWFTKSLVNTLLFVVVTVPITIGLGLLLAVVINQYVYVSTLFKVAVFIPYISSVVASAVVWMVVFQPSYGPVNSLLMSLGVENPPGWFTDMKWALPTVMAFQIWQATGYNVIVFLAGLKGIPQDLYEAATIDGAGEIKKFRHITIPMISPVTFFLTIMGIIATFKVFDSIKVLTNGGPGNETTNIAFYIYREAFNFYNMGSANAAAWIMFVIIFLITLFQLRQQKKWVVYD